MKSNEDLILAYLEGSANRDELERLFSWVNANASNADEFVKITALHGHLRAQLQGEREVRDSGEIPVPINAATCAPKKIRIRPTPRPRLPVESLSLPSRLATVLTIGVILAAGAVYYWATTNPTDPVVAYDDLNPFATIEQLSDVRWVQGHEIQAGERLSRGAVRLESGWLHLRFDDGVEITLQGPAHYVLLGPGNTRLETGLMTATVPENAIGFRVATPNAEVVDLGTTFGIELDPDGASKVVVFHGKVEVNSPGESEKLLVKEGESVYFGVKKIEPIPFNAVPYEKVWPISSGIEGSTGAFKFAPQWPRRLERVESDNTIFVVPEGYSTTLAHPLGVDITDPGKVRILPDLTPSKIPQGTRVKSILLQFNPKNPAPVAEADRASQRVMKADPVIRIKGEITFSRPILGLIVSPEMLWKSERRFSCRFADIFGSRGLELWDSDLGDVIVFSKDRRSIQLDLAVAAKYYDHVRVILDDSSTTLLVNSDSDSDQISRSK